MTDKKPTTVMIKGKTLDLSQAFPMTLGDWEALDKLGVMGNEIDLAKPTVFIAILLHLVKKVDDKMVREDITSIPMREIPKLTETLRFMMEEEASKFSDPTSGTSLDTSISLVDTTGGP